MQPRIQTSFAAVSDIEIIPKTGSILNALANLPAIFEQAPSFVPTLEQVKEARDRFIVSYNAALSGDRQKILERKADRRELNRLLSKLACFVQLATEDDPALHGRNGFDQLRGRGSNSMVPMIAPSTFAVRHGEQHGVIIGKAANVRGASSYEVHACEGNPTVEENWRFLTVSAHSSRIELKDLLPGRLYSFRVRAIGANGSGPWSSTATLMAV